MYLAKVIGTVVSTSKDERLIGFKLMLTRRVDENGAATGAPEVCVDTAADRANAPLDATIVGIVDSVEIEAH